MADYKLVENSEMIYRKSDGAFIPPDTENRDYKEYLEWVDEGNTADAA
jgi:hypothetical protein|tara:strand:- start:279 stop:422 length:144 start_codon:yes stop_codon:yes gene_type:complete